MACQAFNVTNIDISVTCIRRPCCHSIVMFDYCHEIANSTSISHSILNNTVYIIHFIS